MLRQHSTEETPLHRLVANYPSVAQLIGFINAIGIEVATKYAKTIHPRLGLPIHLAARLKFSGPEAAELYRILIDLTNRNDNSKEFSHPIALDEITAKFGYQPGSIQYKALMIAQVVTNLARSSVWQSSTHRSSNGLDTTALQTVQNKVIDVTAESHKQATKVALETLDSSFSKNSRSGAVIQIKLTPALFERYIEERAKVYIQHGVANCGDICVIAHYYFGLLYKNEMETDQINANIYRLKNGDHAFLILTIGHQPSLILNDQVIVCDVLNGEIYPGSTAHDNIKDLAPCIIPLENRSFNYNFYAPYNPRTQHLCLAYEDNIVTYNFQYDEDYFTSEFSKSIDDIREYIFFRVYLEDKIEEALDKELVTKEEILLFRNRISALNIIFQSENVMHLLARRSINLRYLAALDDASIKSYFERELRSPVWINQFFMAAPNPGDIPHLNAPKSLPKF